MTPSHSPRSRRFLPAFFTPYGSLSDSPALPFWSTCSRLTKNAVCTHLASRLLKRPAIHQGHRGGQGVPLHTKEKPGNNAEPQDQHDDILSPARHTWAVPQHQHDSPGTTNYRNDANTLHNTITSVIVKEVDFSTLADASLKSRPSRCDSALLLRRPYGTFPNVFHFPGSRGSWCLNAPARHDSSQHPPGRSFFCSFVNNIFMHLPTTLACLCLFLNERTRVSHHKPSSAPYTTPAVSVKSDWKPLSVFSPVIPGQPLSDTYNF